MTNKYVALIGAANIDIQGFPKKTLIGRDSNPGEIKFCPGGVSRNIAENLSRLGIQAELISAIGGDPNGELILASCKSSGIGTDHSLVLPNSVSSVYLAIMDNSGDMALALSDMTIIDRISIDFLESKSKLLKNAAAIVFDTCLSYNVMDYILAQFGDNTIYVDPVSIGKAKAIKELTGKIHTLKMNKLEAEFLSNSKIEGLASLKKVTAWFMDKGVKRVFVTMGKNGVFYRDSLTFGTYKLNEHVIKNTTGTGDAFMAGIVYGSLNNYSTEKTARFASGVSLATLAGTDTVNPKINFEYIKKITGENF